MAATRGRPPKAETLIARAAVELFRKQQAPTGETKFKPKARYDAAGQGRRMAGWNPGSRGPNRVMEGLQRIRDRSRDSSRNDWSGESSIQKWTTHLIGIGITPRFPRIKSKKRKQEVVDLFNDFVAQADADCVNNLYGMQTLVVRSWLDSGEVFARRRPRFDDEGLPVPMQVQLLEADMCPLLDTDTYVGMPVGNVMRSGIEFNKRGKRVAFWFYKEHPSDGSLLSNIGANDLVRVAASDVCHVFEQKRPGQIRGVSMLAPVLARLRNIENYDDATRTRQQLANLVVGFITRGLPPLAGDEDYDPLTNRPIEEGALGPLVGLQPGLMQELGEGEDVKWSNPPEAGTNYPDYMRTQHMGTAAAAGVPYEIFSGDIKEVSDRTLRVLINEFRRFGEQRQWQIIIPMFCQPVIEWFAQAAVLAGKATEDEFDMICRVEHAPHGWAYIHPVQDPQGKAIEVDNRFRSRSSVISERGDDPDTVDDEIQSDDQREQALQIGPYSEAAKLEAAPAAAGDEDGIDNNEYDAPPNALMRAQVELAASLNDHAIAQRKSTEAEESRRTAAAAGAADRAEREEAARVALAELKEAEVRARIAAIEESVAQARVDAAHRADMAIEQAARDAESAWQNAERAAQKDVAEQAEREHRMKMETRRSEIAQEHLAVAQSQARAWDDISDLL